MRYMMLVYTQETEMEKASPEEMAKVFAGHVALTRASRRESCRSISASKPRFSGSFGISTQSVRQAAIAAVHAQAKTAEETDWNQIAALYAVLARTTDSPVV